MSINIGTASKCPHCGYDIIIEAYDSEGALLYRTCPICTKRIDEEEPHLDPDFNGYFTMTMVEPTTKEATAYSEAIVLLQSLLEDGTKIRSGADKVIMQLIELLKGLDGI